MVKNKDLYPYCAPQILAVEIAQPPVICASIDNESLGGEVDLLGNYTLDEN